MKSLPYSMEGSVNASVGRSGSCNKEIREGGGGSMESRATKISGKKEMNGRSMGDQGRSPGTGNES